MSVGMMAARVSRVLRRVSHDRVPHACRQCSSGLQAVADVAAAIKAGFYTVGIGAGVETMSKNPMAWEGGVNPRVAESKEAQNCLVPMGALPHRVLSRPVQLLYMGA